MRPESLPTLQTPPTAKLNEMKTGRPTGILREWNALQLLLPHIPQPDRATRQAWLRQTIAAAHRFGLTGVHDQRLEKEGSKASLVAGAPARRRSDAAHSYECRR
ncbi:MAG: hypothetical protein M5U34_42985 [Chloroflexi bacterium]|nr:hypothetical protein [Chloroflexota bacterium]